MRLLLSLAAAAALSAGCSGDTIDDKPTGEGSDTGSVDTGGAWSGEEGVREADCSGMDPADPAPLGGWIALTFDDGPDPDITPQILSVLRKHEVPATFFMMGEKADAAENVDLVAEIIDDPLFEVANHSWSHPNIATMSDSAARDEIGWTVETLEAQGGTVEFFRFPYGSADCGLVDIVREEYGLNVAGWHIDTADWCYAVSGGTCSPDDYWRIPAAYQSDMYSWTLDQLGRFDGGVFLYHDVHQYTADEVEDVIVAALAAGYSFTRLDDADAFPNLNAGTPTDFPWVGEACSTSNDTCWQVEYLSYCMPTEDPSLPDDAGVCVLNCEETRCINRSGSAQLVCGLVPDGEAHCLGVANGYNENCAAVPGTASTRVNSAEGGTSKVCLPYVWQ